MPASYLAFDFDENGDRSLFLLWRHGSVTWPVPIIFLRKVLQRVPYQNLRRDPPRVLWPFQEKITRAVLRRRPSSTDERCWMRVDAGDAKKRDRWWPGIYGEERGNGGTWRIFPSNWASFYASRLICTHYTTTEYLIRQVVVTKPFVFCLPNQLIFCPESGWLFDWFDFWCLNHLIFCKKFCKGIAKCKVVLCIFCTMRWPITCLFCKSLLVCKKKKHWR